MAPRDYPRLTVEDFGEHLLLSGDLDPVYIALSRMEWDEAQRNRWLIAYWSCYHPGAASWLSEKEGFDFWRWMEAAALNVPEHPAPGEIGRWPRAPERRHWRGLNATRSVSDLKRRYLGQPERVVDYLGEEVIRASPFGGVLAPPPYVIVAQRVKEHDGFGDWIAYKVADMLERVCGVGVTFTHEDAMYDAPVKSALRLWRERAGVPADARIKDEAAAVRQVVDWMLHRFAAFDAPPGGGRKVGLQEVETILCKHQSHLNGHYQLNNDLLEIRAGAEPWAEHSETAAQFLHHFPQPTPLATQAKLVASGAGRG